MGAMSLWAVVVLAVGCLGHGAPVMQGRGDAEVKERTLNASDEPALAEISLQIVQDNYSCSDQLETAWGFAAYLTGLEQNILFDTGSDGTLLLANMAKLQIDPNRVDTVVISHGHADHTGGLIGFLKCHADVTLYGLKSFPTQFKETVCTYGVRWVEVETPQSICANVYSTGRMGTRIHEQALVIRTERGLVVVTGCAHPGVARMLEQIKARHEENILLVIGGFHLQWAEASAVERVMDAFERLGVRYIAPTHCSGDNARTLFQERFGPCYLSVGVGKKITLADLE